MAKKPVAWIKIYSPSGEYRASCVCYTDAAALCGLYGHGAEARNGHAKKNAIWREGFEEQLASDSYDFAVNVMMERMGDVPNRRC